jgi:predicted O-methyltransferase YrrM
MKIDNKSPDEIISQIASYHPEINKALIEHNRVIYEDFRFKGSVKPYQAAIIYNLCLPYNFKGAKILEIGTGIGYSTSFIAKACPLAKIVTLNPTDTERWYAERQLSKLGFENIEYRSEKSWDYYGAGNKMFDVIFVDGDHKHIRNDYVWWQNVKDKGLMFFHDYTPSFSSRPQTFVFDELNKFCAEVGKEDFDVYVMDNLDHFGMVGFYK